MVISFDTTKCPPVFIKCAARDKRSPTSLNCGQIVEDKATENKKVIPQRSCELSKPFQIMAIIEVTLVTNVFVQSMFL